MNKPILSDSFLARLQTTEALSAIAEGHPPAYAPKDLATAMDAVSTTVSSAAAATAFGALASLMRILDALVQWRQAVLAAEMDADRFVRSARERWKLWSNEYGASDATRDLHEAAAGIKTVSDIDQVATIAQALVAVPLPIGVFAHPIKPDWVRQQEHARPEKEPLVDLTVAFLKFQFDGTPAADVHQMAAREVHDLEIEVRVSRWPDGKHALQLTPVSVEPKSTYDFPSFRFEKPAGDPPFTLRQAGRAALLLPQGMHSRPFEFKYTAELLPERGDQPVAIVGHRTLIVDGTDPARYQVCGYPDLDRKLLQLRDLLRQRSGIAQDETTDALRVLATLANLSGRAVQDAEFKGDWDEAGFQTYVRAELRRNPTIGVDLDEHAHASGGITDLSLRGVPIELKAIDKRVTSVDDCAGFLAQTASYAVAKSKHTAVLCVLDASPKAVAPLAPDALLDLRHHAESDVTIAVLVIQGNLAKPSALSR